MHLTSPPGGVFLSHHQGCGHCGRHCSSHVWGMVRRRAKAAGIETAIGCHTFRATGITVYLTNGGTLEKAQQMAAHESAKTTKLYDRTNDAITLDEVERIAF